MLKIAISQNGGIMKKLLLSSLLFTLSLSSFAQESRALISPLANLPKISIEQFYRPQPKSLFEVASSWTDDSTIAVSGNIDPSIKWVWFRIRKDDKKIDSFVSVAPGTFTRKEYLPLGAGNYTIEVFQSTNAGRYQGSYTQAAKFEVVNTDTRENMDSLVPTTDIQSDNGEIIKLAESITAGLSTDLEKTRAIHDYVAGTIAYDAKALINNIYLSMPHDSLTVLAKKMAICEGYSNITAALNRAVNIPAKKVVGEGIKEGATFTNNVNHAWNEVYIDGRWITQDTTWDAGYLDMKNNFVRRVRQKYFDPDPIEFAKTHRVLPNP